MALYIVSHVLLGGFRPDHLVLAGVFLALRYGGAWLRPLYEFLLPVLLMIALYDGQRYIADLWRGTVHVREPYYLEQWLFGVRTGSGILLPSQWWQRHTAPWLDALTGAGYALFVPAFLAAMGWFRFGPGRKGAGGLGPESVRRLVHAMMWGMFWVTAAVCATYCLYPAAPPWYVDAYGLGPVRLDAVPDGAGAARFDALLGLPLLQSYYQRTPNVFGAIPSDHVVLPLLCVFLAFRLRSLRWLTSAYFALVCFSAVYLNHHYIVDLMAGFIYASFTAWIVFRVSGPRKWAAPMSPKENA